jgi:DNA-binding transcriptional MerR regulator
MAKSAQAFRTIREVADWLGVAAHVLRFWESKFSQIKPVKRAGGRRYYRPADMELVGGIKVLLHDRGMTIRGVKKMMSDEGVEAVARLSPPVDTLPDDADLRDVTPDRAWEQDAAAEQQADLEADYETDQNNVTSDAVGMPSAEEQQHQARASTQEDPADIAAEQAAIEQAARDRPADPDRTPSFDAEAPPEATPAPDPGPAAAPPAETAAPAAAPPPARPAADALDRLAGFAQSGPALAPHLAALKALRDRMATPTPTE